MAFVCFPLAAGGVILEGQAIPVKVSAGIEHARGFEERFEDPPGIFTNLDGGLRWVWDADRIGRPAVCVTFDTAHRKPAESLAVAPRAHSSCLIVVHNKVPNMVVSAEDLDGSVWFLCADSLVHNTQSGDGVLRRGWIVSDDKIQIDWVGRVQSVLEPFFLNHLLSGDNLTGVAVQCHFENDTKRHDAKTLLGRKIAVGDAHVLEFGCRRIVHFNIGCNVAVTVSLAKLVKVLVGDFAQVELVVSWGKDVVVDLFEELVVFFAV